MELVRRADIPSIQSAIVDGKEHKLGILKDFRNNEKLLNFLPKDSNLSISWVHLEPGEILDVHVHPTDSMIVISEGTGLSLGDLEEPLTEGDIVIVPSGKQHGFKGTGEKGFWALSIQFEPRSLYEDPSNPLVNFVNSNGGLGEQNHHKDHENDPIALLLKINEQYTANFGKQRIFTLLKEGYFKDRGNRARLLDCLQVWSNCFQKMVLCRAALCDSLKFVTLAQAHLEEEFGHNTTLAKSREDLETVWDSVLESTSQWFLLKMLTLDNTEKTVLVHLVLEAAAIVFYKEFGPLMQSSADSTQHFEIHSDGELDDAHVKMGLDLLKEMPLKDYDRIMDIQKKGWEMFNTMFDRIADLCTDASQVKGDRNMVSTKA